MSTEFHCPICGNVQPSGTFQPHPLDRGVKRFRSQTHTPDGRLFIHGYSDSLKMAQAAICCGDQVMPGAIILERESSGEEAA